jgi:hypothetical protein
LITGKQELACQLPSCLTTPAYLFTLANSYTYMNNNSNTEACSIIPKNTASSSSSSRKINLTEAISDTQFHHRRHAHHQEQLPSFASKFRRKWPSSCVRLDAVVIAHAEKVRLVQQSYGDSDHSRTPSSRKILLGLIEGGITTADKSSTTPLNYAATTT